MPSDALTVAVTTGLGVSVLAGIISGVCYILTHGLPNRDRKPATPWHCNVCGGQFRSIQGILEVEKVVTCAKCKAKVCRVRCSRRDPQRGWICQVCLQPENWFKGLLKSIYPNKDLYENTMDPDALDELDEDLMELRKKEREQVRDFIERLVESMLGGNLDDVSVSQIYNDKKYLPITGQSPCSAHAFLKQLIQRLCGEVAELPSLRKSEDHPAHPEETANDRTYEDLLSTAIINKVVQSSQNEARSSTNSSRPSTRTRKSQRNINNKEYFFGEETLENKWKNQDSLHDDASSVSSLDEWVRSDSSIASSKYVDRVSLTIKQQIEEGSSSDEETLESLQQSQENSFLHPTDETWHENWYFQKRRLTNSSSPVPVPMLVPNPITEAKVLIGDKEAEELSDIDSDYGDPEVAPDIKNILVNSKTVIGGKNVIHTIAADLDELKPSEDVQGKAEKAGESAPEVPVKSPDTDREMLNEEKIILSTVRLHNEDLSLMSIDSNTEQDTEYTEQYASLPRTFLKSSVPVPRETQVTERYVEEATKIPEHDFEVDDKKSVKNVLTAGEDVPDNIGSSDEDAEDQMKVFKGSYSEREKEKWNHSSVEIPDNPYSPENLERRLSSRSSNDSSSSIFGRDYYVRDAAKSAGARKKTDLLAEPEVTEYSPTADGNDVDSQDTVALVTAVCAVVQPEESIEFKSVSESSIDTTTRPAPNDISSDSDLSIERVYNLQSGRVFEKKGNVSQEITNKDSYSPEGIKYMPKAFDEDTPATNTDENHNNTNVIKNNKLAFMRSLTQNDDEETESFHNIKDNLEDETIDTVPYDDIKFKATLEMFKTVAEGVDVTPKIEKYEKPITPTIEKIDFITPTKETSDEFTEDPKIEPKIVDYIIPPDRPQYFGDAKTTVDNKINTSDYSEEEMLSDNREFSLEYSTDINEDDMFRTESSLEADPEIMDLKEKRLVKDLLGKFSQSFTSLSSTPVKKNPPANKEVVEETVQFVAETLQINETINLPQFNEEKEDKAESNDSTIEEPIPSVKNLKQLFDKENNFSDHKKNPKQIYSLTARSLPRQFRQKLKSDEDELCLHNEETPTDKSKDTEDDSETSLVDITRNRIAYFENLENKKKHH